MKIASATILSRSTATPIPRPIGLDDCPGTIRLNGAIVVACAGCVWCDPDGARVRVTIGQSA